MKTAWAEASHSSLFYKETWRQQHYLCSLMIKAAVCLSRVPSELKKRIQQARLEKKLTQAQLGQLINEKPQVCSRPRCSLCHIPDRSQVLALLLQSCQELAAM